jgi:N12 class adenine-specific DNA methylase
LARWHGWGAAPQVFDRPEFAGEREVLRETLGLDGFAAAARTTLNAHYTDPEIVRAMWGVVEALGATGGVALEPGCGRGTFLAEAPPSWRVLGVELDPSTARVAEALADGRHAVVAGDFAALQLVPGAAQAVVGNVPFGSYALFDPDHNPQRRLSIHDHFIAKAVTALAPGGVAVVVTSRYTLDKLDPAARQAIGERADFVGAVRLPGTAHEAEAGTRVVTDVLVLRARPAGEPARHALGWDDPPEAVARWGGEPLAEPVRVSRYFVEHPDQVLGTITVGSGLYGVELRVEGDGSDLAAELPSALARVAEQSVPSPALGADGPFGDPLALVAAPAAETSGPVGRIERTGTGVFRRLGPDGWERYDARGRGEELAALVSLRDLAERIVTLEAQQGVPEDLVGDTRTQLRAAYDGYVGRWGPINRVAVSDAGRRTYPRMGGFRSDPGWPRVASLEVYDEATGKAAPAAILERRLVEPTASVETAATPEDALAISLQRTGGIDPAYVGSLLSLTAEEAMAALGDRAYLDPGADLWVPAEEYLSGNVRAKLAEAEAAVLDRPELARNAEALRAIIPRDVTGDELERVLGAPWVSTELVQDFARELCPDTDTAKHVTVARADSTGTWVVAAPTWVRSRMSADHEFGLARLDALRLLEEGLNGRAPQVAYTSPDGVRVVDAEATARAVDLAEGLRERFDAWLLREDPDRADAALRVFNDRYNAHVPRTYAAAADAIAPDGLRSDFTLRPHQRQAVARMVYGGNTLLAHPVGAGKTAEMIVGAMELRRLGTIRRPCFVVPNHMLGQFSADIVSLYPGAQVLAIGKDQLNARNRAEFAARVQTHDWDAVVITHASFSRWPVSPQVTADVAARKITELRADIVAVGQDVSDAGRTLTKRIEKRLANHEERLKAAEARQAALRDDHEFFFDESGIDHLLIDEAHEFKNAELVSNARNLRGVPVGDGSVRSQDLDAKLRWLRDAHPGRPVLTMATATPIANTVAELWVMARYLRPDLLEELHVGAFDGFRAMFADTTSDMEIDASGTRFRRIERLSRYKNLPELGRLWGEFVDVVTADQLDLPRPTVEGGGRQIVLVDPAPQLRHFMAVTVSERAEAVQRKLVEPHEDNFLKLTTEARIASFDWETYTGEAVGPEHSTLVAAANRIVATYLDTAERTYRTATGELHPRPGAFQIVFSDLGTPKPGRDDTAYDRLRQLLVDSGVPADKVAFVHEHDGTDEAKARFFAACRDGRIAVAVSSTSKMGMGTNVQDRLVALHHLDCPWRPLDIEQREGRIVRQGNQNPTVTIHAYAAERSYAVHGWQTLERKAGFVGQIMRVDPNGPRSLEPDDAEALSYGQVKALATGDPDFLRLAELEDQLARLERLQRSHHQEQAALSRREGRLTNRIVEVHADIDHLRPIADGIAPAAAGDTETFMATGGTTHTNRGDAARSLQYQLGRFPRSGVVAFPQAGVAADWEPDEANHGRSGWLTVPTIGASIAVDDPRSESALVGNLTRLINRLHDIPRHLADLEHQVLPDLTNQLERTTAKAGEPFTRADKLRDTRSEVTALRATLENRYKDPEPAPTAAEPTSSAGIDDVDVALANLGAAAAAFRSREQALTDHPAELGPQAEPATPEASIEASHQ